MSAAGKFIALAGLVIVVADLLPGQNSQESEPPPPTVPPIEAPAEFAGYSVPRRVSTSAELTSADQALAKGDEKEVVSILDRLLGPPLASASEPQINTEGDRYHTTDGMLFTSLQLEVAKRIEKLSSQSREDWSQRRGPAWAKFTSAATTSVEAVEAKPWGFGGYSSWTHKLTNFRELRSSTAAKNAYYAYSPMRVVFVDNLVIGRSHQDIVAFDRSSGEVRWRVETDVPQAEQTVSDGRSGAFDSWRYFTDLGGWSVTVVPGTPPSIVVIDKPCRLVASSETGLTCARNRLRAHDAASGAKLWERGGSEDSDEVLRGLTFVAAPTVAGEKSDTLMAPATSGDAFHVVGLTLAGGLLWVQRIYDHLPAQFERLDESMAHGATLAAHADVVVGAPGQGLVFAMNTRGETLWQARYASSIRDRANEPRWGPGHPLVSSGKAIAAPFDGDSLVVHELRTGALVWSKRFTGGYHLLLGADATHVHVVDGTGRVSAYVLANGADAWTSESLGQPTGRGLVASGRAYVAVERAVVVLDAEKGTVLKRCRIWDERVSAPCPGNLQLFGGDLFMAAPWGYGRIESYEETLTKLEGLDVRERLLRKAMVAQAQGSFTEAFEALRQVMASTADPQARESLGAELFQVAQEAAATTRDLKFIERVLGEPELLPSKAHRIAFTLRSMEILAKDSPAVAAQLGRELVRDAAAEDIVQSSEGFYVDVAAHASNWLDSLRQLQQIEPNAEEESRVEGLLQAALASPDPYRRLVNLALIRSHTDTVVSIWAHLAKLAAPTDAVVARQWLDCLVARSPVLGTSAQVIDLRDELARRVRGGRTGAVRDSLAAWGDATRWRRQFLGKSAGAELVSTREGSEPLPGMLVAKAGMIALLDEKGAVTWKHQREGIPDLAGARDKLAAAMFDPAQAQFRDGHCLVFTAFGLVDITGLGGADARARTWLTLKHPLAESAAGTTPPAPGNPPPPAVVVSDTATAIPVATPRAAPTTKVAVDTSANFFPRLGLAKNGDPLVVAPDGSLLVLERRTGRIAYRANASAELAAGEPQQAGGLVAVTSARPPGVMVHDPRTRSRLVIPAPNPPWRSLIVPGVALVTDSLAGIQVRELATYSGHEPDEPIVSRVLWRDAKPRGFLALAFADAEQVLAVESGGKLVSRELSSGRHRWQTSFPEGSSPVHVVQLDAGDGKAGDFLVAAVRGYDADGDRGFVSQKVARDLNILRVSRSGEKRWESKVAEGQVQFNGALIEVVAARRIVVFSHKVKNWRVRGVGIDLETGATSELFELAFDAGATAPPPRVAVTRQGIAVGNAGTWALFTPAEGAAAVPQEP